MDINIKNTIAIAVDLQNGFINSDIQYIIPKCVDFISELSKVGIKIFATKFINTQNSNWVKLIKWNGLIDSSEQELMSEINDLATRGVIQVVEKQTYSSIPTIESYIQAKKIENVIIFGVSIESCVTATAFDAFDRGLCPIVISDLSASSSSVDSDNMSKYGLKIIQHNIGKSQIMSAKEFLELL
jgi:nicotinamidase-related amidase